MLSLVYYQCKILCPEEIDGLVGALEMMKFNPGRDFDVVLVSIDATETPAIAAREKAYYMKRYGQPEDGGRLAFSDRPAAGDPSAGQCGGIWIRADAGAGREDERSLRMRARLSW